MSKRILLNGKKAGLPEIRNAILSTRSELCPDLEVRVTWEYGDIHRMIREASQEGVSRLVVAGGDGTVNEAADALMQLPEDSRPEIAILPLGTANDFATGCQIPVSPQEALKLAIQGAAAEVDVLVANSRHFINVAAGGFGAQVTADTPVELKNFLGGGAYTLTGMIRAIGFKPYQGIMRAEGLEFEGEALVGAVCNGRQTGGGQILAPNAYINDGLMDVVIFNAFPFSDIDQVIAEIRDPLIDGIYIKRFQTNEFEYELDKDGPLNLDGEPYPQKKVRFQVKPKAIRLVVPKNCACLKPS